MKGANSKKRFWLMAGLIFIGWSVLVVLFAAQFYFIRLRSNRPFSLWQALSQSASQYYIWGVLTPVVLWLGERFPVERRSLFRSLSAHLVFSILLTTVHMSLTLAWDLWLGAARGVPLAAVVESLVIGRAATNIMIYWGLFAVSQAINYFSKYQEREYRLAQAQLQALKAQLHPHFFFNTLNAISELVYKDPEAADRTITQLSDLLRFSFENGEAQEVALRDELLFLGKYISLQQTLLQDRLKVAIEIDSEAAPASVPSMILQPLVENAIRHGIAPRSTGGRIEVSARRENGSLHLRVRDDGPGMPEGGAASKEGIGLSNTRARLEHLYGKAHRFELTSTPGGGLTVSLHIPFRESGARDGYESSDANSR